MRTALDRDRHRALLWPNRPRVLWMSSSFTVNGYCKCQIFISHAKSLAKSSRRFKIGLSYDKSITSFESSNRTYARNLLRFNPHLISHFSSINQEFFQTCSQQTTSNKESDRRDCFCDSSCILFEDCCDDHKMMCPVTCFQLLVIKFFWKKLFENFRNIFFENRLFTVLFLMIFKS